jgi:hypothetical protein
MWAVPDVLICLLSAHRYGDGDRLGDVVKRALAANQPKKVHNLLLGIYERAGETSQQEALLKMMIKRYKHARKVCMRVGVGEREQHHIAMRQLADLFPSLFLSSGLA